MRRGGGGVVTEGCARVMGGVKQVKCVSVEIPAAASRAKTHTTKGTRYTPLLLPRLKKANYGWSSHLEVSDWLRRRRRGGALLDESKGFWLLVVHGAEASSGKSNRHRAVKLVVYLFMYIIIRVQ